MEQLKYGGYTTGSAQTQVSIVSVEVTGSMEKLRGAGMIRLVSADMDDFYELTDKGRYTEKWDWIFWWIRRWRCLYDGVGI